MYTCEHVCVCECVCFNESSCTCDVGHVCSADIVRVGPHSEGHGRTQHPEKQKHRGEGGGGMTLQLSTSIFSSLPAKTNQITTKGKKNV